MVFTMNYQWKLTEKFLRYAGVTSQSKAGCACVPSTEGQRTLAHLLADELKELGLQDIYVSDHAVVTAFLPARLPVGHADVPKAGWVAHLDTVDIKASPDIHPVVVKDYSGGDICQNIEKDLWIRISEHPELEAYKGQDIIVSDGTSVLGADNKAAVANVMTALEILKEEPERYHGDIYVAFVPDEEVGLRGAKSMELDRFPVDFAYTIDCCALGEVIAETFNAGSGIVKITGRTAHPMNSKGNLVNPCVIATDLVSMFDRTETPECTEKKEGYIWVTGIRADALHAEIDLNIRDHDLRKYEARKTYIREAVALLKLKHPKAEISVELEDVYGNILDAVTPENRQGIDYIFRAMEALDITPDPIAMRGGTDGSYLSKCGILTPNYFTGAHNFHSTAEFMPMGSVEKSLLMTLKLMELIAEGI